jgi:predicted ATPase
MPTNSLEYITIKGFRSIASIEKLPLRAINVVIGPNGSGKSNFLGAFRFLQAIAEGKLAEFVSVAGGAERVLHFGSKTTKKIELILSFKESDTYDLALLPTDNDVLVPAEEVISPWHEDPNQVLGHRLNPRIQGREAGISDSTSHWPHAPMRDWLRQWRTYHLDDTSSSSPMRKTANVDDNRFLRPDGSNLAAFLYFLKIWAEDSYSLIVRTVQRVAPFFDDFQLEPTGTPPNWIKLEWRHKGSDQYFDASSLSDGTLRFIALATLFLLPKKQLPSVILVDEPELGLHPYAIEILAALVRQASVTNQVILSTQSSRLLDHFDPEDVLVANRVNGATQLERQDPKRLAKWLEDYSLGQLWEKNEIGGRPVPG